MGRSSLCKDLNKMFFLESRMESLRSEEGFYCGSVSGKVFCRLMSCSFVSGNRAKLQVGV